MSIQTLSDRRRRSIRPYRAVLDALETRQLLTLAATQYPLPMVERATPTSIAKGSDGNLWITESQASQVVKLSPAGAVLARFDLPAPKGSSLGSIVAGKDGAFWFSEFVTNPTTYQSVGKIARITAEGVVTEFPVEAGATVASLAASPDGNIWFTENVYTDAASGPRIGRLTPDGQLTTFAVPGGSGYFGAIATGPDGNLWFTDQSFTNSIASAKIGRITTDGVATEFSVPDVSSIQGLAAGPDGNLWFGAFNTGMPNPSSSIGKITTAGASTLYALPTNPFGFQSVVDVAPGADGNTWFLLGDSIARVTPAGAVTKAALPFANGVYPNDLTLGPDGNVWLTAGDSSQGSVVKVAPDLAMTTYALPTAVTNDPKLGVPLNPSHLVKGDDGALWFSTSDGSASQIRKISVDGAVTAYDLGTSLAGFYLTDLKRGPDGKIWYVANTGAGGEVGRVDSAGAITRFPTPAGLAPSGFVAGADGNLWATAYGSTHNKLLRIGASGEMKTFAVPKGLNLGNPLLATADGRIWFDGTRSRGGKRPSTVGEVVTYNPATRAFTEYALPKSSASGGIPHPTPIPAASTLNATTPTDGLVASPTSPIPSAVDAKLVPPIYYRPYYQAQAMTVGADGNIWIAASDGGGSIVVKTTPRGKMTSFAVPDGRDVSAITLGSDGNVWFSMNRRLYLPMAATAKSVSSSQYPYPFPLDDGPGLVGRITPQGVLSTFTLPDGLTHVDSLATGPDGNIWLTDGPRSRVAKFVPPALFSGTVEPSSVTGSIPGATNDPRPTIVGSAAPNAYVAVYAMSSQQARVELGRTQADAKGAWSLEAASTLPDGTYTLFGGETRPDGSFIGNPTAINNEQPLIVDASSPRIATTPTWDAATGTISFTIVDAGVGFDVRAGNLPYVPYLSDASSYALTPNGSRKPLAIEATVAAGATPNEAVVTLRPTSGFLPVGPLKLTIKSKSIKDQAGNLLDGENRGPNRPSGNGRPGGDYVVRISRRNA